MSLINQMLQDLDKRGSVEGSDAPLRTSQAHVRTVLASARKSRWGWWIALLVIAFVALIGTWGALTGWHFWRQAKPVTMIVKPPASGASSRPSFGSELLAGKMSPVTIAALPAQPAAAPADLSATRTTEIAPSATPAEATSAKPLGASENNATLSAVAKSSFESTVNIGKKPASDLTKDFTASFNKEPTIGPAQQIPANFNAKENISPGSQSRTISRVTHDDAKNSEKFNQKKVVNARSDSAEKLTAQAKEITPQQAIENNYRKAVSLIDAGQLSQAISTLEQVLQLEPKHAAARQTLVGLLLDAKRQDDAMRRLQEGLAIDPAQSGMAMILARLQVERGTTRIALQTLDHSLPYALNDAEYQAFFAALLQREKRNKEAIEHYAIALNKVPENGLWWMGYGISLQAENRLPEAKDAFTRAKESSSLSVVLQTFVNQKLSQMRH